MSYVFFQSEGEKYFTKLQKIQNLKNYQKRYFLFNKGRKYRIFQSLCNLYSRKKVAKNRIDSQHQGAYT